MARKYAPTNAAQTPYQNGIFMRGVKSLLYSGGASALLSFTPAAPLAVPALFATLGGTGWAWGAEDRKRLDVYNEMLLERVRDHPAEANRVYETRWMHRTWRSLTASGGFLGASFAGILKPSMLVAAPVIGLALTIPLTTYLLRHRWGFTKRRNEFYAQKAAMLASENLTPEEFLTGKTLKWARKGGWTGASGSPSGRQPARAMTQPIGA